MKISERVGCSDVIALMLDTVCVVDRHGYFVYVNDAFERMFGYKSEDVIGNPMIEMVHPDDRTKTLETVDSILSGDARPSFENRWCHKDGRVVHVLWSARWSEEHQVRIAVAHDITERKQQEERLLHQAGHDLLTGLPNRALLLDRLQSALARSRREQSKFSLLFIDLDGFKQVNDSHGHCVGDRLLQAIALRLRDSVRESDTVGRLGGDEFLVLLNGIDVKESAVMVAENIRDNLARLFQVDGLQLMLSPSIGIAHYPEHGEDHQQLMLNSDKAMYQAKKSGGNQVAVF